MPYHKPQKPRLKKRNQGQSHNQRIPIALLVGIAIAFLSQQDFANQLLAKIRYDLENPIASQAQPDTVPAANSDSPTAAKCHIKGNISISSGRKIYHLPGMEDYEETNIEAKHGERWFCSEADAVSNGWKKAPN